MSFPKYEYFIANQKYADIAKRLGLKAKTTEQGVDSLIEAVKELNRDLNIPKTLREAGVDEQEFLAKVDKLSEMAFEDQCTTANPRVPLVHEIKELMLQAYYGERE